MWLLNAVNPIDYIKFDFRSFQVEDKIEENVKFYDLNFTGEKKSLLNY